MMVKMNVTDLDGRESIGTVVIDVFPSRICANALTTSVQNGGAAFCHEQRQFYSGARDHFLQDTAAGMKLLSLRCHRFEHSLCLTS